MSVYSAAEENKMRLYISQIYSASFANKLHDDQLQAVYLRLRQEGPAKTKRSRRDLMRKQASPFKPTEGQQIYLTDF